MSRPGLSLASSCDLACHLSEDPGLDVSRRKRPDDGDDPAVLGDEGWFARLFDFAHYAGRLLVEITHAEDQGLSSLTCSSLTCSSLTCSKLIAGRFHGLLYSFWRHL